MIEIYPQLFIGNQEDYYSLEIETGEWFVIQACKEPFHREAVGYKGRSSDKNHPEYLVARRKYRLILNLVDAQDSKYFPSELIALALREIEGYLPYKKVLVHCNQGQSRSPGIGLLFLLRKGIIQGDNYEEVAREYQRIYPDFSPGKGMRDFIGLHLGAFKKI